MIGAMFNNLMLSTITGGTQLLLMHHPLLRNQLWMGPILESLTLNSHTDGGITKDLAKDPGKAEDITDPTNTENVVENLRKIADKKILCIMQNQVVFRRCYAPPRVAILV